MKIVFHSLAVLLTFKKFNDMKRGKYPVRTLPASEYEKYNLGEFPNFDRRGSVIGMKNLYYGLDAKLVRCGGYIYNVTSAPEIYDAAH